MNKVFKFIFILCIILAAISSCEKTYEDGNNVSLRSKKQRLTGKWKLIAYYPLTEDSLKFMRMELFKEKVLGGVYKAKFESFKACFCWSPYSSIFDYFTSEGTWQFFGYYSECDPSGYIDEKEGLRLTMKISTTQEGTETFKILKLTNEELILLHYGCGIDVCCTPFDRKLTFKKE